MRNTKTPNGPKRVILKCHEKQNFQRQRATHIHTSLKRLWKLDTLLPFHFSLNSSDLTSQDLLRPTHDFSEFPLFTRSQSRAMKGRKCPQRLSFINTQVTNNLIQTMNSIFNLPHHEYKTRLLHAVFKIFVLPSPFLSLLPPFPQFVVGPVTVEIKSKW